jgi:hypothetical protein
MLKSIGRSSHFWAKIVGGTVSPPPLVRKTIVAAGERGGGQDWPAWDAKRDMRIDIPLSQTIVSYNCLNCNVPVA